MKSENCDEKLILVKVPLQTRQKNMKEYETYMNKLSINVKELKENNDNIQNVHLSYNPCNVFTKNFIK